MKGSLFVFIFYYTGKNDIQESTPKIQMLMFGLAQTSHIGLWDISPPPPEFQLAFFTIIMKTHLRAKGLVGTRGGDDVLKIFFYFLYV